MADSAPSGGWEPFEIIVIIILVIALLNRFQGTKVTSTTPTVTAPKVVVKDDPTKANCGLHIVRPTSSQSITSAISLAGTTTGCNWKASGETAMYAQAVDKGGVPVSDYVTVPVTAASTTTTSFAATIPITGSPIKGTGYLILISPIQNSTVRIPIVFK